MVGLANPVLLLRHTESLFFLYLHARAHARTHARTQGHRAHRGIARARARARTRAHSAVLIIAHHNHRGRSVCILCSCTSPLAAKSAIARAVLKQISGIVVHMLISAACGVPITCRHSAVTPAASSFR
eukprot:COSAG06_NODE_7616_length_2438_cov_1.542540_3_plen_128_part_00